MSKITIKQIAELAGVSVSAVSFVLNNKKGVSDDTRRRVLKIIDDLNYTPNVNSRRLTLHRSFNIIVSIEAKTSPLDNFFYVALLNSIVKTGGALGYNIVLSPESTCFENSHLADALSQSNADGIIFLRDISSDMQAYIDKAEVPFVIIDTQKSNPPYPCVKMDYQLSAYTATMHLISKGHKKIAFIGVGSIADFYLNSFNGYKAALSEANIQIPLEWIRSEAEAGDENSAKECIKSILRCKELPTAIYCTGDILAIGIMSYLQDCGLRIPEDFSICSVDDIILSRYYHPALTTINVDKDLMGRLAVEMLDRLIRHEETDTLITIKSDDLIERSSVKTLL